MENTKVISKGSYSTFRFNDFVSVKQYLLIREDGDKYLLLKLSNDAQETVTGLKLTVEQLDVRGVCVETSHVEWTDLSVMGGDQFISPEKIPLRENCIEVKINLVGATYGEYTYTVKSNELVVVYNKKAVEKNEDYSLKTNGERVVKRDRKFKRPFSLIAAACLAVVCALVGILVHLYYFKQVETRFIWRGVRYEFVTDDKEAGAPIHIVGYDGGQAHVVIPEKLEGYPITGIAASAFRGNPDLQSIKIEANVEIYNNAFQGCSNLESVELSNVTKVGDSAFAYCTSLRSVTANELQTIGNRAFGECRSLETLTISGSEHTLSMGSEVFINCTNLATVDIDQAVKFPKNMDVFKGVSQVRELSLKHYNSAAHEVDTDKTIADLFNGSMPTALVSLTIDDIDAIPVEFCAGSYALQTVKLSGLKTEALSQKAFYQCERLTDLSLGFEEKDASIAKVGDYALYQTKIASFDGKNLTEIGAYAFANNVALTTVNVANNTVLETLGENAFAGCEALESFQLPKTIDTLPASVFKGCKALRSLTFASGSAIKDIKEYALYNCESLTSVSLPTGLVSVGESAFENCKALTSIRLPNGLETIGNKAFAKCAALTEMKIPASVKMLGTSVLYACDLLQKLETPIVGSTDNGNAYLAVMFGGTGMWDAYMVPATLQEITLTGDGIIASNAFYGVNYLKKVNITGAITSIESAAFYGCTNLRELRLNSGLQNIGEYAFGNCYLLFEVWNLSNLSITRGSASYGHVGQYALWVYDSADDRCESSEKDGFQFLRAEEGWYMTDHAGENTKWELPVSFKDKENVSVRSYAVVPHLFEGRQDVTALTIPSSVKSIGEYAFASCMQLETVKYNDDVELDNVANYLYAGCYALTSVSMPANGTITAIGDCAFENCNSLSSMVLPNSVKTIGSWVFSNCSKLTDLTIGNNTEMIGGGIISGTTSLQSLTVPYLGSTRTSDNYFAYFYGEYIDNEHWQELDCVTVTDMETIPEKAFYQFRLLKSVVWEKSVQNIGAYAFENCYALENVNFQGTFTEIGERTFAYCDALRSITLPDTLTYIGQSAFYSAGLQNVSLPQGLLTIDTYAFYNADLTSLTLPRSLQTMGESAFANNQYLTSVNMSRCALTELPTDAFALCNALKKVNVNNASLQTIGYSAFYECRALTNLFLSTLNLTSIADYAFYDTGLTEVSFPATLQRIGEKAFSLSKLETVTLSGNLTELGYGAFSDCDSLQSVDVTASSLSYLPEHAFYSCDNLQSVMTGDVVENIGNSAFYACGNLQWVTIGYNVKTVGAYAFYDCVNLQSVTMGDNVETIGTYAFYNCDGLQEIVLGNAVKYVYSYAFYDCNALAAVTLPATLEYIEYSAFECCWNLFEVYNLSGLPIERGSWDYGCVAYNAMVVHKSTNMQRLQEATSNGMVFKYVPNGTDACLYEYNGSAEDLQFNKVILGGRSYTNYWIYRNVFNHNQTIKSVDTGVVQEIGDSAFYNCDSLKKVVLGSNLGKVSDNAFSDCDNLWEVWDNDNSNYNLTLGTWECGYVAYNAVAINQEITYFEEGDFQFMEFDNTLYLYGYTGSGNWNGIEFPEKSEGYVLFKHRNRDSIVSSREPLVIPTSVQYIQNGAIYSYCDRIYYKGDAEQWAVISKDATIWTSVYYYSACVHNNYLGTNNWTYYNGKPTVSDTTLTWTTVREATCQQEGEQHYVCDICKTTFEQSTLSLLGHDYSGENGACKWCQQRPVASGDLGALVYVQNNSAYKFLINDKKEIYSDWRADYDDNYRYTSEITLVAQKDVTFTCTIEAMCDEGGEVRVYVNEELRKSLSGEDTFTLDEPLKAGDSVRIEIRKSKSMDAESEARVYVKDITVKEIEKEEN